MSLKASQPRVATFLPVGRQVPCADGKTILQLAQDAGIAIPHTCGGAGTCGKCGVTVHGPISPPTQAEREALKPSQLEAGVRLACQVRPLGDVLVAVEEHGPAHIVSEGLDVRVSLAPSVRKRLVHLPPPSLDDQRPDLERSIAALSPARRGLPGSPDLGLLRSLPGALRSAKSAATDAQPIEATAVIAENRLIAVEPGDTRDALCGVAFDIGTTTVVGYLLDLNTGRRLAVASDLNPQAAYGADVIARITHTMQDADGLSRLREIIVAKLNALIGSLCEQTGLPRSAIYDVTVAGNTTMHHLALGLPVESIALAPYTPVVTQGLWLAAADLGLEVYPQARVYMLPNIASYVGADIVADLLACRLERRDDLTLMIDIGTNGEIVIGNRERIVACSTAAGPCFEGGNISCGMRASAGAISAVRLDESQETMGKRDKTPSALSTPSPHLRLETIGSAPPKGLCGTGLIDAVALMLRAGIIDDSGRMLDPDELTGVPDDLRRRVRPAERGNEFALAYAGEDGAERDVVITQRDVRELQNAKGAILAGIRVLLRHLGKSEADIGAVLLAGAFGTYIRRESALAIGLIPPIPIERIRSVGNAAGTGAQMALLSVSQRRRAERLARQVEYLELSGNASFPAEYAEAMFFPQG
jgi:uncharacterized 2Fe-2S/4Fe-4S cluster protein (DUF4445 family)